MKDSQDERKVNRKLIPMLFRGNSLHFLQANIRTRKKNPELTFNSREENKNS